MKKEQEDLSMPKTTRAFFTLRRKPDEISAFPLRLKDTTLQAAFASENTVNQAIMRLLACGGTTLAILATVAVALALDEVDFTSLMVTLCTLGAVVALTVLLCLRPNLYPLACICTYATGCAVVTALTLVMRT